VAARYRQGEGTGQGASQGVDLNYIDSHAHLADPAFDADRPRVIQEARDAGCRAIVSIGASIADANASLAIAREHPGFVFATAGVHPHDASSFDGSRDTAAIREAVAAGAVAIGECGLDYHYDNSPRDVQRSVLSAQLALASELTRPMVIHTREAEADTIAFVRDARALGVTGILHCFTGTRALAEVALEAGWFISFAGVVTFRKWEGDDLIRMVPDDRLLAETDAPYLAPVPFRGKRNEPRHVVLTIARLANARGQTPDHVGDLVTSNAIRCFSLNA
jgi:TatD DNase family protein